MTGSRAITAGTTSPPIPLAVSTATVIGRSAATSTNDRTCWTYASSRSRCSSRPTLPPAAVSSRSISPRISRSPDSSPTGRAPGRQNLMPLYSFGLWLAVIMTAGMSNDPLAK